MPRGRQYYDPIVQVPGKVEGAEDLSRIELYPEGAPDDPNPRWCARQILSNGSIGAIAPGDFNHDRALAQAQAMWPNLPVYELRSEGEDSTWEGMGPSPRLWQTQQDPETQFVNERMQSQGMEYLPPVSPEDAKEILRAVDEPPSDAATSEAEGESIPIRAFAAEAGTYMHVEDVRRVLNSYAAMYDEDGNPSASLALRTAADMLGGQDG